MQSNQTISALQLVPKGVIRQLYSMKGNENAMGLNILKTVGLRKEALKYIDNRHMYFADHLKLQQSGAGVFGCLPVFQDNEFWRFSVVIFKLEDLLKSLGTYTIGRSK